MTVLGSKAQPHLIVGVAYIWQVIILGLIISLGA